MAWLAGEQSQLPGFALVPVHYDPKRVETPRSPTKRASSPYTLHPAPRYEVAKSAQDNCYVGLVWQQPLVTSPVPRMRGKRGPIAKPTPFIVCDHHCVRKLYPTKKVDVKNRSSEDVTVAVNQHFPEANAALDFDRRNCYG